MAWTYDDREVLALSELGAGQRVLEVGFGAGALLRRMEALDVASLAGVDPSPRMVADATARNRRAVASGRMTLSLGTAAETGYPDASFERVVSVHNVALWPDLRAGIAELRRVVSDGGMGRTSPLSTGKLRLPEPKLDQIAATLSGHFARVERVATTRDDVFRAWPTAAALRHE